MIFLVRFPERFGGRYDRRVEARNPVHAVTLARSTCGFHAGSVVLESSQREHHGVRVGKEHPEDIGDLYEVQEVAS